MSKTKRRKREFISLEVSQVGFVVYGMGAGTESCVYRDMPLSVTLDSIWRQFPTVKRELNAGWKALDKENPKNPGNLPIIQSMLRTASWAYTYANELPEFAEACMHGPTDPLRHLFLYPLEEIFTRCFAAAHIYGLPEESTMGLSGLVRDFTHNGGINLKTGKPGHGFSLTMLTDFHAYFAPGERAPIVYERFGGLIEALVNLVLEKYPHMTTPLAAHLGHLQTEEDHGFASTRFQSPAKSALIANLAKWEASLWGTKAAKAA